MWPPLRCADPCLSVQPRTPGQDQLLAPRPDPAPLASLPSREQRMPTTASSPPAATSTKSPSAPRPRYACAHCPFGEKAFSGTSLPCRCPPASSASPMCPTTYPPPRHATPPSCLPPVQVWGYFSVKGGGAIHEYSDSQVSKSTVPCGAVLRCAVGMQWPVQCVQLSALLPCLLLPSPPSLATCLRRARRARPPSAPWWWH